MNEKETSKNLVINTINKNASLIVNKQMIRNIGLVASVLLSDLISKYIYFTEKETIKDEEFWNTEENREWDTGLSSYEQQKAIKILKSRNILEVRRKGVPARQHFKLNFEEISKIIIGKPIFERKYKKEPVIKKPRTSSQISRTSSQISRTSSQISRTINKNKYNKNNKDSLLHKEEVFSKKTPIFEKEGKSSKENSLKENSLKKKNNFYLEHWNSLKEKYPLIREHKNPNTKTYQKAVKMLKHLRSGTFDDFVSIDHKFLKRSHIPLSLLRHKWTQEEILTCINRLPKLFINGYWPDDKTKLPKDLNTLIYNPRTNTSFFLLVKQHPPKPNGKEKTDEQIDNEIKSSNTGTWTEEQMYNHLEKLDEQWK